MDFIHGMIGDKASWKIVSLSQGSPWSIDKWYYICFQDGRRLNESSTQLQACKLWKETHVTFKDITRKGNCNVEKRTEKVWNELKKRTYFKSDDCKPSIQDAYPHPRNSNKQLGLMKKCSAHAEYQP